MSTILLHDFVGVLVWWTKNNFFKNKTIELCLSNPFVLWGIIVCMIMYGALIIISFWWANIELGCFSTWLTKPPMKIPKWLFSKLRKFKDYFGHLLGGRGALCTCNMGFYSRILLWTQCSRCKDKIECDPPPPPPIGVWWLIILQYFVGILKPKRVCWIL
jgi:hypothetical protein